MKRLLSRLAFSIVMGFMLWGCNNALDYNENEGQKERVISAKDQLATPVKPFGGRVDAVLPYLFKPFLVPTKNEQKPYFFNGENYNWIKFEPDSTNDELLTNTTKITDAWASLKDAGFDRVDAVLTITRYPFKNSAYFFKDDQYIKVKYEYGKYNDELLTGPTKIIDAWPSLRKAGFNRVDAAFAYNDLSVSFGYGAYVFSGDSYVRIRLDGNLNDTLESGPTKIASGWPTLRDAGFSTVDAVLPVNGYPNGLFYPWNRVYVFSGDRYLYMKFKPGGRDELISGPSKITDGWPYLR